MFSSDKPWPVFGSRPLSMRSRRSLRSLPPAAFLAAMTVSSKYSASRWCQDRLTRRAQLGHLFSVRLPLSILRGHEGAYELQPPRAVIALHEKVAHCLDKLRYLVGIKRVQPVAHGAERDGVEGEPSKVFCRIEHVFGPESFPLQDELRSDVHHVSVHAAERDKVSFESNKDTERRSYLFMVAGPNAGIRMRSVMYVSIFSIATDVCEKRTSDAPVRLLNVGSKFGVRHTHVNRPSPETRRTSFRAPATIFLNRVSSESSFCSSYELHI
jgi:hypothetical protein